MRLRSSLPIILTALTALLACSSAPSPSHTEGGPEPAPAGAETAIVVGLPSVLRPLAQFVPAAAALADEGECKRFPIGSTITVLIAFPRWSETRRNVSVVFDSAGRPLRYSDLRGELRRGQSGLLTSIVIDFVRGTAHATNEWPDRVGESADGDANTALSAVQLGPPQEMIDLIRSRCGTP